MKHRWVADGIEEREPGIELNQWKCRDCGMIICSLGSWPPSVSQLRNVAAAESCNEFRVEEVMRS